MRFRQCAIWGDSASVRWMVVPRSWTILLTSSLLAGSAFSIGSTRRNYAEEPRGVSSQPVGTENVEQLSKSGGALTQHHDGCSRPPLEPPSHVAAAAQRRRALRFPFGADRAPPASGATTVALSAACTRLARR